VGSNNQPEVLTASLPVMNSEGKQKASTAAVKQTNNN
jgi:hypothetical protein